MKLINESDINMSLEKLDQMNEFCAIPTMVRFRQFLLSHMIEPDAMGFQRHYIQTGPWADMLREVV